MSLTGQQRREVKSDIKKLISRKLENFKEKDDMNKPFYFALLSEKNVLTASFLASLYTSLGSFWEQFAKEIAKYNFVSATKETVRGKISTQSRSEIDSILDELDSKKIKPNITREIQRIKKYNQGNKDNISQEVDLILKDEHGRYTFFELKSTKPNKNEMKAAKRDLLKLALMKNGAKVYLGIPYNPYFSGKYKRWTVKKFFKEGDDFLIGKQFWDYLGGENTYEDLLAIFKEVGNELEEEFQKFIDELSINKSWRK